MKTPSRLIAPFALAAGLPALALAGDMAIDVHGTVIALDVSVPPPFASAQVGDTVHVHYSVFLPGDLSVPNVATYELDHTASSIRVGGVVSPISSAPYLPGESPVKLIDGTQDGLIVHVRMPGNGEWFSTAISDPTGALVADLDLLNMQRHSAGPFGPNQGGSYFVSLAAFELTAQIDLVEFGPQGDSFGGPYCFGGHIFQPCPCGNAAGPDVGCANSTGAGARLQSFGGASLSNDSLSFVSIQEPPGVPGLLLTGTATLNAGLGFPVADGLLCVGGQTQRLDVVFSDVNGTSAWGPGLLGPMSANAGEVHYFQSWYRNVNGSPCGGGFNFSNGVSVLVWP